MFMKIITDKKRIDEIFERGVVSQILPSKDEFLKLLFSGKRLRIYMGADPTSDSLHLGHAGNYMLLEDLRQLGHEIILLVGDFTAQIGDPTGKSEARNQLTEKEVKKNVKSWSAQLKSLLDFKDRKNPPKIVYNSKWLSKLSFKDIISIATNFTVQQMIERDMFDKRWKSEAPIYLHEFFYPLMQGYDSVVLDVDAELCGTDQIFNALAGRTLLKRIKNKDKFVIATNLLGNPKTGELMSKSKGTGVFLSLPPSEMFGAIMSQPDEMTESLFINCTRIPLGEKEKIIALGPRDAKARVAFEIVKKIYGEKKAKEATEQFDKVFKNKETPENIIEISIKAGERVCDKLVQVKIIFSNSEWHRLIQEGAVRDEGGEKISDPNFFPDKTMILKIGKRRFVKFLV
jgi:tyrosyl-tRNA synthetase